MHIWVDFAPELLRQSDMDKQAFTVDLISHLSVQYALPKSFSTARLAVNVLSTLLSGNSLQIVTHHNSLVLLGNFRWNLSFLGGHAKRGAASSSLIFPQFMPCQNDLISIVFITRCMMIILGNCLLYLVKVTLSIYSALQIKPTFWSFMI